MLLVIGCRDVLIGVYIIPSPSFPHGLGIFKYFAETIFANQGYRVPAYSILVELIHEN